MNKGLAKVMQCAKYSAHWYGLWRQEREPLSQDVPEALESAKDKETDSPP